MTSAWVIVLVGFFSLSSACLITNCPRGGKRADQSLMLLETGIRECTSCGRDGMGRCFGPYICCGSKIGCFIGTPETYKCRKESLYLKPCIAGFAMCRGNKARCAANGICCSQEACYADASCRVEESETRKIISEFNSLSENSVNTNERIF